MMQLDFMIWHNCSINIQEIYNRGRLKMNIVRLYNQNRKKFWRAILIIASLIILLRFLNYYSRSSSNPNLREQEPTQNTTLIPDSSAVSNYSVITGGNIPQKNLRETENLLDEFIGYCNSKK